MKTRTRFKNHLLPILLGGIIISLASITFMAEMANAASILAPLTQATFVPTVESAPQKECTDCHPDKRDAWSVSTHANSANSPVFLAGWEDMERSEDCLLCHKATYDQSTGEYLAEGTTCETCHGAVGPDHPPAEVSARSDEEYCGTCHPATIGEVQISGHSASNEVRCSNCHDPHSQKIIFENPDDMCNECHAEDIQKMDETLNKIHLQENLTCADCHMLDVPHNFVLNSQHEDTSQFFNGFDCASDIVDSTTKRIGTSHEEPGSYLGDQMNWPVVHRVARLDAAPQCSDCHIMDSNTRADFIALGYSPNELDKLSWEGEDYPALTSSDLNKLVAQPRKSWNWVYWMLGVVAVFGVFELTVAHKLEGRSSIDIKASLASLSKKFNRKNRKDKNNQQSEE